LRWGVTVKSNKIYATKSLSGGSGNEFEIISDFQPDTWYVLLILADTSQFMVRVWERDNPSVAGRKVLDTAISPGGGGGWHFLITNIYSDLRVDEYSEGRLYSASLAQYDLDSDVPVAASGPYTEMQNYWVRATTQSSLVFDGEHERIGPLSKFTYNQSNQGNIQVGNLTHTVEAYWNEGTQTFVEYRVAWTRFVPNGTAYLVNLHAISETFKCPSEGCNTSTNNFNTVGNLMASTKYIYDSNSWTNHALAPTAGILKGTRTLTRVVGSTYYYLDTVFTYDAYGNNTILTRYAGEGTGSAAATQNPQTTTMCYGTANQPSGCTNDGYHTYLLWTKTIVNGVTHQTSYAYTDRNGYNLALPTRMIDPNGRYYQVEYDNLGRPIKFVRTGDYFDTPTIQATYVIESDLYSVEVSQLSGSDGSRMVTRSFYDGLGALIQTQTVAAEIGTTVRDIITDLFYDGYGRLTQTSIPYRVGDGNGGYYPPISQTGVITTFDILNRPLTVTATDGSTVVTQNKYLGFDRQVIDARGNTTTYSSDAWGRLVSISPSINPGVTFTYDAMDRMLTASRGGLVTTYTYDKGGRVTQMVDPDLGTVNYDSYDALGNLLSVTDARGCRTTLAYDGLSRLLTKTYHSPCPSTPGVTYTYDSMAGGNLGKGHLTGMQDSSGRWSYAWKYDGHG
jgi:YD repeat-containing protein